jgi:hypothetical protein
MTMNGHDFTAADRANMNASIAEEKARMLTVKVEALQKRLDLLEAEVREIRKKVQHG